jgi:hypothetical protein
MKNRVRTLLLVACAVVVLALRAVPASGTCATKCGAYIYKGMLCFNCCTCCVLIDGSIDCICSADCEQSF